MPLSDCSDLDTVEEVRRLSDRLSSTISSADQEENYKLLHHVLDYSSGYASPMPRTGRNFRRHLLLRSLSPPSKGLRSATPPLFVGQPLLHPSPEHFLASSQTSSVIKKMPQPHLLSDDICGSHTSKDLDDFRVPTWDPVINTENSKHQIPFPIKSRLGNDPTQNEMATPVPPSPSRKASIFFGNLGRGPMGMERSIENFGEGEDYEDGDDAEELLFDDVAWKVKEERAMQFQESLLSCRDDLK